MKNRLRQMTFCLLFLSGVAGCAQLPLRGWLSRRDKPTTTEEEFTRRVKEDANRLARKGDDEGARRLLDQVSPANDAREDDASDVQRDVRSVQLSRREDRGAKELEAEDEPPPSGGGQFDVSSDGPLPGGFGEIEAPAPKRRAEPSHAASDLPRAFAPPANMMPLPSAADVRGSAQEFSAPQQGVTTAEFTTRNLTSEVVPASATQALPQIPTDPANPWNRFQNLEDVRRAANVEPDFRSPGQSGLPEHQARDAPPAWPAAPPAFGGANTGYSSAVPTAWPHATAGSHSVPTLGAAMPADMRPEATATTMPSSIQLLSGETSATAPVPFPNANLLPPDPRGVFSTAGLTGLSNGFAATSTLSMPSITSPELERLVVQTGVEVAAMTPGTSEAERQAYLRKQVQLRLLQWLAGQTDRALQPIPGIDSADQEFWQQMLWGMANYFDSHGMPDAAERATQTIAQLQAATQRLQEKARLELRQLAFCHKITGFGSYLRFPRDQFTPGQPVLLYAEVANFKSEPTADGQFRTLMKSTIDILEGGPEGRIVESVPFAPSEDRCRNQRRDYFHSYEFAIPQGIRPGPHVLQLTVEDQLGRKTVSTRMSFRVA